MNIGIDASHLGRGGGVTHMLELLRHFDPADTEINTLTIWAEEKYLDKMPHKSYFDLIKIPKSKTSSGLKLKWQYYELTNQASNRCDILFIPGGYYFGRFKPYVTMIQNSLPFDGRERSRFAYSFKALRYRLLKWAQYRSAAGAAGTIFLSDTARNLFEGSCGDVVSNKAVIHLGVSDRFDYKRPNELISQDAHENYFRWLYVSPVKLYKHQWNVVYAVNMLRDEGYNIGLDLVGHSTPRGMRKLRYALRDVGSSSKYICYHGNVSYEEIHKMYREAHAFVFASSCENCPLTLLEAMRAGLPIACSNRSASPEITKDAAEYFDPDQPDQIAKAMRTLMDDRENRIFKSQLAYKRAQKFTWEKCARDTFSFILETLKLCT